MATGMKPIRRVVTGVDALGKSNVVWDGPMPNTQASGTHAYNHPHFWVWHESPAPLRGDRDDCNSPYEYPSPPNGGRFHITRSSGRPPGYDPANDAKLVPAHAPKEHPAGRAWDRGG